jgi:MerR family transcriptional regulator/heat shock protein HspR
VLARYESLGLVRVTHEGSEEGYEPAQIRRLWSIVTYQRDLGINLAGVEVILHLVDHLSEVHHRVYHLAEELRELLDEDDPSSVADSHG